MKNRFGVHGLGLVILSSLILLPLSGSWAPPRVTDLDRAIREGRLDPVDEDLLVEISDTSFEQAGQFDEEGRFEPNDDFDETSAFEADDSSKTFDSEDPSDTEDPSDSEDPSELPGSGQGTETSGGYDE